MVRIGVVSDTHRHIANLNRALEFLNTIDVGLYVHLGDDYTDPEETTVRDFLRVPGVFSDAYADEGIPNRIVRNVAGWKILLTHTIAGHPNDLPGDPSPEDLIHGKMVDVVLFGHTHVPEIREEGSVIAVNPGHLKNEDKRGHPPTFACIELTINRLLARIYRLSDFGIIAERAFRR